jgi:CRISPR type III-B/RAMP module RAMP protein Cmr1
MDHTKLELKIVFDFPAFTHGADENNPQLRLTELKAELRRWWRVLNFKSCQCDEAKMREKEFDIFGGGGKEMKASHIRFKSKDSNLKPMEINAIFSDGKPLNPEKKNSIFYIAYGIANKRSDFCNAKGFFSKSDKDFWQISCILPTHYTETIEHSFWMLDQFGAIGNRSSNGWGSISIKTDQVLNKPNQINAQTIEDALNVEWPSSFIDWDGKLLIWKSNEHKEISETAMVISKLKKSLKDHRCYEKERRPNYIFFKVKRTKEGNKYYVIAYLMPFGASNIKFQKGHNNSLAEVCNTINETKEWQPFDPFKDGNQ